MTDTQKFDAHSYLTKVGGADYLEVKWRLVWLRMEHPDAEIYTDLMTHVDQTAIFKARVILPGGGSATGWGTETYGDFRDYVEKAETKALGRALAALGFGTQFTYEFDEGEDGGSKNVVDAPVSAPQENVGANTREAPLKNLPPQREARPSPQQERAASQQNRSAPRPGNTSGGNSGGSNAAPTIQNPDAPASPSQHTYITDLLKKTGKWTYDQFNWVDPKPLTKGEASLWIEALKSGNLPEGITDPNA
jgi:hypothetical protein